MNFVSKLLDPNIVSELVDRISKAQSIWIFTHEFPDGDALGSAGALALAMKSIGKSVQYFLLEPPTRMYSEVPGNELATLTKILPKETPDMVFILDSGSLERISIDYYKQLKSLGFEPYHTGLDVNKWCCINIDHHISNDLYGHLNFVTTAAAATAEMIFELLNILNINITKSIAEALYIGIVTDTGKFFYGNTTPLTLAIGSELLKTGFKPEIALANVYYTRSVEQLKLFGEILSTLEPNPDLGYVICYSDLEMYKISGGKYDDTESLPDVLKTIGKYKISLLIKQQTDDTWKVSLRNTHPDFNASIFAQQFSGGGHPGAAGFSLFGTRDEVLSTIKNALFKALKK